MIMIRACLNSLFENKVLNNTDNFGKTVFLSREQSETCWRRVSNMCVKICDCRNCFKKKTCVKCPYLEQYINAKLDCYDKGVQGCPHKINDMTRPQAVKGA